MSPPSPASGNGWDPPAPVSAPLSDRAALTLRCIAIALLKAPIVAPKKGCGGAPPAAEAAAAKASASGEWTRSGIGPKRSGGGAGGGGWTSHLRLQTGTRT